jgi:hypothetical protein
VIAIAGDGVDPPEFGLCHHHAVGDCADRRSSETSSSAG